VGESRLVGELPLGTIAYADPEGPGGVEDVEWPHRFDRLLESEPLPPRPQPDPAEPVAIFFTSGSTGPAKGVTHTRSSLRWMIASAAAAFELDAEDVFLPGSSMSHIGAFLWTLSMLSAGGKIVVARSTDAHELLPLLREQQPTVLAMIPAALSALIHDHDLHPGDFSSLRVCRAGADKVSTQLLAEFSTAAGFPIVEGYGMTEVGLATLNPPSGEVREGSIGRPIHGFAIALRDEAGEPIEAGEVGRIWIRSPSRMVGYWEAPEATEEVVIEDWLDSGDLARADEDGYLWFFGRKKQVIVHDGSNISPYEVEGALVEHSAVDLAGVVGVHDETHGENVRAYVTLGEGVDPPSRADLIVFCRERIGYKAPDEIVFLDEMPLNPTGKIDRAGLKRMAEDHLHPHGLS
jgi:long-chain acyl-CoA synthetase